ncbi:MAG: hypothetical protein KC442_15415, partial [Thermomicrobiales bacterium]|nr:hypothetical protein [Thermomicrobiales bacterium]
LAFFAAELTPSYPLIGLAPALAASLWTVARVPGRLLLNQPARQQQWAFASALVRAGAIGVLAFAALRTSPSVLLQSGRPLLLTFFLCLIVYTVAGGLGSVPASSLARAAIAPELRVSFSRRRALAGLAASLLGALLAARLLGVGSPAFPGNYGRLFLVAAIFLIALAVLTALQRPLPQAVMRQPTFGPRALARPLTDGRYLRYLVFRLLLAATAAIDPFLFLYAVIRLSIPASSIGVFIIAGVLGWVATTPLWSWLEHKAQPRTVLQAAAVLRLVAPALALLLPQLATVEQIQTRFGSNAPTLAFAIGFLAIGAALSALARGGPAYLAPLSPRPLAPAYSALTSGCLAVAAFAPVAGGLIIQRYSYETLFVAAIVVGLAGVLSSGWLAEVISTARQPEPVPLSPAAAEGAG